MKRFAIIVTMLVCYSGLAQIPDWTWGHNFESFNQDSRNLTATDLDGNVFLIGNFNSESIVVGGNTLSNDGATNTGEVYIVKFDPEGNILWVKKEGGPSFDSVTSVATDSSGNVIVAGSFNYSITFDNTVLSHNSTGTFVAKYNPDGDLIWARSYSGQTDMYSVYRIKTDAAHNVYMTGFFITPTVSFGEQLLINENFAPETANGTVFVAKFDPDGNPVWAKNAQRTGVCNFHNISSDLAIDGNGNVFIGGYFFTDTIQFDGFSIQNPHFGQPFPNVFMAKYDAFGNCDWARSVIPGGFQNNYIFSVNADTAGNAYFGGTFTSTVTIDDVTLTASSSGSKMFVLKLDESGNLIWAKTAASNGYSGVDCADVDPDGNVYVGGTFNGPSIDFGSGNVNVEDQSGNLFVAKYAAENGDVSWVRLAGPTNINNRTSISVGNQDEIFVGGYFYSQLINFGNLTLQKTQTTDYNIFVTKLQHTPLASPTFSSGEFKVCPNPMQDFVQISQLQGTNAFAFYDEIGRLVTSGILTEEIEVLSTQNLVPGVYFLKISNENGVAVKKLLKP